MLYSRSSLYFVAALGKVVHISICDGGAANIRRRCCELRLGLLQTVLDVPTSGITFSGFWGDLLHSYIFLTTIIL
jgi:hypothetical protein